MSRKQGKKYGLRKRSDKKPNQWQGSLQQEEFLFRYFDPASPTFGKAKASALEAGYSEAYAQQLASKNCGVVWFKEANDLIRMHPEHTLQALQSFALDSNKKDEIRLRALELLGKSQGIFVERR